MHISPFVKKKLLEPIQSYEDVPISGPKWTICPKQNFFGTNHYCYFHLPIGPFHCAKFKKMSYSGSRVMRMHHFWTKNGPFAPKNFFWKKLLISFLSTYWPLKIVKKFLQQIQKYEDAPFLGPKWSTCPNENFFQKKPC